MWVWCHPDQQNNSKMAKHHTKILLVCVCLLIFILCMYSAQTHSRAHKGWTENTTWRLLYSSIIGVLKSNLRLTYLVANRLLPKSSPRTQIFQYFVFSPEFCVTSEHTAWHLVSVAQAGPTSLFYCRKPWTSDPPASQTQSISRPTVHECTFTKFFSCFIQS